MLPVELVSGGTEVAEGGVTAPAVVEDFDVVESSGAEPGQGGPDAGVDETLVATHTLSPGWSNVVATTVGTVPSFELNRRWVWTKRGHRSLLWEIAPFCRLSAAGLAPSTLIVSVSPRPLSPPNGAQLPSHSSPRQLTWPPSDPCG
jgi:hypothetical protein